jgi:glutamate synthase domain-containing protein 3
VLGRTGRNFAAGMSGGVAYVLDEDGTFAARCNPELVGLAQLSAGDEEIVVSLVREHVERTGSTVGERVLAAWEPASFVKVLPHDFRRVLEQAALRLDPEEISSNGLGHLLVETRS